MAEMYTKKWFYETHTKSDINRLAENGAYIIRYRMTWLTEEEKEKELATIERRRVRRLKELEEYERNKYAG